MSPMMHARRPARNARRLRARRAATQRTAHGSVVVEVTVTATLLLVLVLGLFEFARYMLTWNAASEATRIAARMSAAGCADATVEASTRVRTWGTAGGYMVPSDWLDLQRVSCGAGCELVRVSIKQAPPGQACSTDALTGRLMLPGLSDLACLPIPSFTHSAIRESGGGCN
jgi:hypothetical protein